ncbi:MAG: fluoride efflux transporter CrcB [Candidatus Magnetomorum sp.]|nr:fluoride efflux transporter CrcB [Candidatus Magnetomorum sp.]
MLQIWIVGLGGFIGATLRFVISTQVQQLNKGLFFPWGTISVNLLGCLIMGILIQLNDIQHFFSPEMKSFVFIGILGALTTYSTFSNDALNLILDQRYGASLLYIFGHLTVGLFAVFMGRWFIRLIIQ